MDVAHQAELGGRRFAFLSHWYWNLYRFRLPVMQRLTALGAEVVAIAPLLPDEDPVRSENLFAHHGVRFVPLDMGGASVDPKGVARAVLRLTRALQEVQPDVLQSFTLKPNVVGAWAARWASTPVLISTVTGLGRVYSESHIRMQRPLAYALDQLTRISLRRAARVVFQNPDDQAEYLGRGLCRPEQAALILSSGVDLQEFTREAVSPQRRNELRAQWGIGPAEVVVTMVARLLPEKGVREFAAAAQVLRGKARFVLIGPRPPGGRGGITEQELAQWQESGAVVAPGTQQNIVEWLAISDIFALPTYYREGVPRTNLEAMAMELPVVTTDAPGCRETVVDGENGFLVAPRDIRSVTDALEALIKDRDLRISMGQRSRVLAEERFEVGTIAQQYIEMYHALLNT